MVNPFEINKEKRVFGRENAEARFESKEDKENAELKKMAAKERVEMISVEVQQTQKQIQNILANMQQVLAAVKAIRKQLGITDDDQGIPSVAKDEKRLGALKKKLAGLKNQLQDLRGALVMEEEKELQVENSLLTPVERKAMAEKRATELLKNLGLE